MVCCCVQKFRQANKSAKVVRLDPLPGIELNRPYDRVVVEVDVEDAYFVDTKTSNQVFLGTTPADKVEVDAGDVYIASTKTSSQIVLATTPADKARHSGIEVDIDEAYFVDVQAPDQVVDSKRHGISATSPANERAFAGEQKHHSRYRSAFDSTDVKSLIDNVVFDVFQSDRSTLNLSDDSDDSDMLVCHDEPYNC